MKIIDKDSSTLSPAGKNSGKPSPVSPLLHYLLFPGRLAMRRVLAVCLCEVRLQLRSFPLWILCLLACAVAALFGFQTGKTPPHYQAAAEAALSVSTDTARLVLFVLPFLFLGIFQRDVQRKVQPLLWTRQLSSLEYALGKGLAVACLSALTLLPPLLVGWLAVSYKFGMLLSLSPWLSMWPVLASAAILLGLLTLLGLCLLPGVLAVFAAFIGSALVLVFSLVLSQTMLKLTDISGADIYFSASIGFGPDSALVWSQRLCYLALALLLLGLLSLAFQVRERRGVARLPHWLSSGLLVVLATGLLISSIGSFQQAAASAVDAGPYPSAPIEAQVSGYRLSLTIDSGGSGSLSGTATFTLKPEQAGISRLSLLLNPGLQVQKVTANNTTLPFTSQPGWTQVTVGQSAFARGEALQITVSYGGKLTLSRKNYASLPTFSILGGTGGGQSTPLVSYLGQGIGFLQGAGGNWYPLPWTRSAVDVNGNRLSFDDLQLRVPSTSTAFCALGTFRTSADGQWQELHLQPRAPLPLAFLAILTTAHQAKGKDGDIFFQGDTPDPAMMQSYTVFIQYAQELNRWLHPASSETHIRAVVLPLLKRPVVDRDLLFVPEKMVNSLDEILPTPTLAEEAANAWWKDALLLQGQRFGNSVPDELNPAGTVTFSSYLRAYSLLDMLAGYSFVAVVDRLQPGFQQQEQTLCQQLHDISAGGKGKGKSGGDPQAREKILQRLQALGVDNCSYDALFLQRLAQTEGATRISQFLQQFLHAHAQVPADVRTFLSELGTVLGRDLTDEADPYICGDTAPDQPLLNCLNVDEQS